jgi:hypothetical protein
MLIMRRQILNEFGAWISLDDENAHTAIRDYGLKSTDESLRKLAKQLGPFIGESTTNEAEPEKPTAEAHYYRGVVVPEEHAPAQQAKPEQPEAPVKPNKPVKKRYYRGQVIKS